MSTKTTSQQLVTVQTVSKGSNSAAGANKVYDGEFDPNYNSVVFHLDDAAYSDHLLKDKSTNQWDEFLADDAYVRRVVPTYFGPKYQDWSTHFGENAHYIVDDIPNLRFGTTAFTIEFWMKSMRNDATQHYIMGKGNAAATATGTGWVIGLSSTNTVLFYDAVGNTQTTGTTILLRDVWYHVAIVRTSTAASQLKIYVNGALSGTGTSAGNFTDNSVMYIGKDRLATAGTFFGSMMTDLRITASAVYSAAFTAPTSALSMASAVYGISMTSFHHTTTDYITVPVGIFNATYHRQRMIDSPFINNTTKLTGHGSHSLSCWDNSRYQMVYDLQTGNSSLKFGTGAFTVEAWIYVCSYSTTDKHIVGKGNGSVETAGTTGWGLGVTMAGQLTWYDAAIALRGAASGVTVTITNYIGNGTTTITGTVASTTNWQVGDVINISGATLTEQLKLNGTWVITAIPSATTFTFTITTALAIGTLTTTIGTAVTRAAQLIYTCGWYHVAAVRQGTGTNQFAMYVNGKLVYTGTVATNYIETQPLTLFGARPSAITQNFGGFICGLRLSTVARYTTAFTADQSMLDTSMTADSSTSLLMCTTGVNTPASNHQQWIDYGTSRLATWIPSNEVRPGQQYPYSRHGYSMYFNASNNKLTVGNSSGDLNFGTGDFSIEFWHCNRYHFDTPATYRYLVDSRINYNDTGIAIRYGGWHRIEVITNGRVVLTDSITATPSTEQLTHKWMHICVQRVAGIIALYINGKKISEAKCTDTIGSPGTFNIGSGSYPNLHYTLGASAWMADFRILKGSGAYTGITGNPESFILPTQGLTAITNCVLLTFNQAILGDYSGRGNKVYWDRYTTALITNSWTVYPTCRSPYSGKVWDGTKQIYADTSDTNGGFYARSGYNYTTSTWPEYSWITRMVRPWTIEMWVFAPQTDPATPTQYNFLYTSNTTGVAQEGFILRLHSTGAAASYGNVAFSMYTAHNSAQQNFASSTGLALLGHSWNHVAVVYDPTATNKMAIFVNGNRVATNAAFAAGQKVWHTNNLTCNQPGTSEVRISNSARYNNDVVTYTVPTQSWVYDANTFTSIKMDHTFVDKALQMGNYFYGTTPSYKYKKFGTGSIKFSNKETGFVERINVAVRNWVVDAMATRQGDYTIETWANWWDAASGGEPFDLTEGNWLWSFTSDVMRVGVAPISGLWKFQYGTTVDAFQLITSTVPVATMTSGNFDHIVVVRRAGNYTFYVNGVEMGTMLFSYSGTYTAGLGPVNNLNSDISSAGLTIGGNWASTQTSAWSGCIQDFRFSLMARYETAVINNIPTMVYAGTTKPALPTKLLQTK